KSAISLTYLLMCVFGVLCVYRNRREWMKLPDRDHRLFRGSRGRILVLLHHSERTVNELAETLKLADNTVRAHLATLEQDGFIERKGLRQGVRKPHYAYRLTSAAEQLFLKACDPLL